jgi:hypothetical protein
MGISNQKQVIKMKHFKFILFFLICSPLIRAQECISGNCENGFGTVKTKTTTYTGSFKEGLMHGKGKYVWKDGGSYKGDFREGFFEGIGVRTYKSGTIYKGYFKYDKPHGEGTMTNVSGSIFKGLWQFGYKHGQGSYKDNKGYSHEGNYKFGNADGFGKQQWKNGDVYEGNFKNGYREGYGIYTWPSGETYKGHWKKGKKHGKGISEKNNRLLKKGIWFEGEYKTNQTGCLKEGSTCGSDKWCCLILNENFETYYTTTKKIKVSSQKVNLFLKVYPEAKKRFFYDKNWKLTSENKSKYYREYAKLDSLNMTYEVKSYYTSNDQLQWDGNIRNNNPNASNCDTAKCEGKTTWYREDSSLSSESNHLEGRKHGKSILYLKNGKTFVMNYDRGKYIKKE